MRGQAATCLFESSRRAEATAFHTRPSLKERNVDLSFYEPLYTSVVLENNNYIIQGEESMGEEHVRTEEYQVNGDELVAKVKELVHEGNIRRVTIRNEEGKDLIEIPLTWGVVGALLLPVWAAIGALAALVTDCTIVVEKVDE